MSGISVAKVENDLKEWKPKRITNLTEQRMNYSTLLDIHKKQCYHKFAIHEMKERYA